ncbi:DsbE family thiol:disulfide interchange protein [Undibacter mobilis]|uniref:DsbE family thiol:disulfide interchange protein n=1 Tax=Undibacter mobilis TaxID=2292256 RepID=A0A371B9H3_9BRAD|nr:DsbE family thiol:disulfide interchange protein [Undibacter mobilis]RDV04228.1 DsbE family thiol:disulfide interchange protein [Undibacter mobilis]
MSPAEHTTETTPRRRSLVLALPLIIFAAIAALFYFGLIAGDPSKLPSALIGKQVPPTDLPPLEALAINGKPVPGLKDDMLKGHVTLVNVWASWCVPCHDEAPLLDALAKDKRFNIVGINYKDVADNARRFLNRYGNPFTAVGVDEKGRASIDWGVYGVPETFLIGRDGRIAYKLVGPITPQNIEAVLKPQIEKALQQP